jgi:hypothetical protein
VITTCYVCRESLDTTDAHTYHDECCPARHWDFIEDPWEPECAVFPSCGQDVHADCCPTCNPEKEDL